MLKRILNKRSKKREKIKMENPQEIKIRYEPGKMIFEIGDQKFYLTEETAGSIFGRSVGLEFERLHGQDDDFGGLRSLQTYVRVRRLLAKGLGMPEIARVLNCTQERVRQFYASERGRPQVESYNVNSLEIEREKQGREEMDYVREAPRPRALNEQEIPEPGEKFIDLQQIKNLQRQGMKNEKIADFLGVDRKEFDSFLEKNQRYLNLLP